MAEALDTSEYQNAVERRVGKLRSGQQTS